MRRLTFQCVVSGVDEIEDSPEALRRFVDHIVLMYGDKHQDYFSYSVGEIQVENYEGE